MAVNDDDLPGGKRAIDARERHPQAHLTLDSEATRAEIYQCGHLIGDEPPMKKTKFESLDGTNDKSGDSRDRKGTAPIKAEFLVKSGEAEQPSYAVDDDAAEGREAPDVKSSRGSKKRQKNKGQNKARDFGNFGDQVGLCSSRNFTPEFSPGECKRGDSCKFEHDLRRYLKEHKRQDLQTLDKICPVFQTKGRCPVGYKCRFLGSHLGERKTDDGKNELYLVENPELHRDGPLADGAEVGTVNEVPLAKKMELQKRKFPTPRADRLLKWLDDNKGDDTENSHFFDNRAAYVEGALLPSEKRKLYFGRDTPALAPLTTQGNLPYRRLCTDLGAQLTYSEMAMSIPLLNGQKPEWALIKAHETETTAPKYGASPQNIVHDYDNSKDLKFGAQISGNRPWNICKATEVMTALCPHLRLIDVNCGCPIDLVYDHGAGSALLNSPAKLERMLMSMNVVSGEVPITCKIRMGTKDKEPTALKLVNRLVNGPQINDAENNSVGQDRRRSGVAAITLHGRSRQQRYTKSADWSYIADCAAVIKRHREESDNLADTVREIDPRDQPSTGKVFFLGNGDCYSHVDYYKHLDNAGVDSVMVARGALIKPWLFEEIEKSQYLDKSASERLGYVEKFVRYGLDSWGSDELGVNTTRRFLLEWLSFAHRYVPIGILEHLPPSINERPPWYRGRNDLETLLASGNYKDWIKITDMFLGPAGDGFKFQPKHKSHSYDYNAEG